MSTTTINYGLKKPTVTEYFTVEDQNGNMDLIDTALKNNSDNIATEEAARATADKTLEDLISTKPTMTTADLTYYVNTATGNDTNNGLTIGTAFKTIQKAIDVIPQIINHTVTINVAAGTYDEDVIIRGFSGKGVLMIQGDTVASTSRTIRSLSERANSVPVSVYGLNATTTTANAFFAEACNYARFQYCQCVAATGAYNGIMFARSHGWVGDSVFSNRYAGVVATVGAVAEASAVMGTNNVYGLEADNGGILCYTSGTTVSGTSGNLVASGLIVDANGVPKGVLPLAGGTLTGDFGVAKASPRITLTDTSTGKLTMLYQFVSKVLLRNYVDTNNYCDFTIDDISSALTSRLQLANTVGGTTTYYKVYGEHNVTLSTAAPGSALAEGAQHQVY